MIRDRPATTNGSILYGVFKGMGDLLAAAPVVKNALDHGSNVTLMIYPQLTSFVRLLDFGTESKNLDFFIVPADKGLRGLWRLFGNLSKLSPTLVLVSPHAPSPAASWKVPLVLWISRRLFWRSATVFGARSEPFSVTFSKRLPIDRELPLAEREWTLYQQACPEGARSPQDIRFKSTMYRGLTTKPEFDLMIHPGSTATNRKWPVKHYAELMRLLPQSVRIAIVGLPGDLNQLRGATAGRLHVEFISGSLEEAIVSMARARVILTMDSGSMFFANMLGIPTVTLFGPSAPQFVIPKVSNIQPVYEQSLPCQPCRNSTCRIKTIECMLRIEADTVAERLMKAISIANNTP